MTDDRLCCSLGQSRDAIPEKLYLIGAQAIPYSVCTPSGLSGSTKPSTPLGIIVTLS
jgi:hypothetical protein